MSTGLPLWLSFRRCRHGVCGIYGEHWGGPEGDSFGRAVRRFEELGIGALAINCVPPDHVTGMVSWLRDFTDLPLGVYPNLGYLSSAGWRNDQRIRGAEYAELAVSWRQEGAQVIGGCCGVGPEHLEAARDALEGTSAGHARPEALASASASAASDGPQPSNWSDPRGRGLFPLEFPDLLIDDDVAAPTHASFMLWKYLYREGIGAHRRCVDIGSGSGLMAVQLALNGAAHVHAIDVEDAAVRNTLTNAFRAGVADRVSAACVDLYPWVPEERYDVIVALIPQAPRDPFAPVVSHRPRDFWGRGLFDHLLGLLPRALADEGVAYVVQMSVLGARRTTELLERFGYSARVVDFAFVRLHDGGEQELEQVLRVEEQSDAYHLHVGDEDVTVAYLLEIRPVASGSSTRAPELS